MKENAVDNTGKIIVGVLLVAVFLVVGVLAVVLTINAITSAYNSYAGNVTQTISVINETASPTPTVVTYDTTDVWVNSSGNTLQGVGQPNWHLVSFTLIDTDDNSTIDPAQYNITNGVITNATETTYVSVAFTYTYTTGYALPKTLAYTSIPSTSNPVLTQVLNSSNGLVIGLGNFSVSASGVVTNLTSLANYGGDLKISYTYSRDVTANTTVSNGLSGIKDNSLSMVANFFDLAPTIGTILAVVILIGAIVILVLYISRMKNTGTSDVSFQG